MPTKIARDGLDLIFESKFEVLVKAGHKLATGVVLLSLFDEFGGLHSVKGQRSYHHGQRDRTPQSHRPRLDSHRIKFKFRRVKPCPHPQEPPSSLRYTQRSHTSLFNMLTRWPSKQLGPEARKVRSFPEIYAPLS